MYTSSPELYASRRERKFARQTGTAYSIVSSVPTPLTVRRDSRFAEKFWLVVFFVVVLAIVFAITFGIGVAFVSWRQSP